MNFVYRIIFVPVAVLITVVWVVCCIASVFEAICKKYFGHSDTMSSEQVTRPAGYPPADQTQQGAPTGVAESGPEIAQ